ncbi:MAG: methyltransferase [Pseudomonadales bacterium]|nr:hypothetical protein [Pseudomonadales bacterium]MCP5330018.1 methyltransferase [Pseudomonadales bacterium]MCP5343073.1 methyltransferase [Pseudomonadales bacterium]
MSFRRNRFAVALLSKLMRFATRVQAAPTRMVPPPFRLLQVGSAFWLSRALHAAAELELADFLGEETLAVAELAERAGVAAEPLYRLLRMLAANGIFEEAELASYRNNPVSHCLRKDAPGSVREMVLLHNSDEMSLPWYQGLVTGLRENRVPFEVVHGRELFSYLDQHPDFDRRFAGAMSQVEALLGDSFVTDFDWGRFRRVIDIGGSNGNKSIAILKQWPQLSALVFDRESMIASLPQPPIEDPALAGRITWQGGDLFDGVPPARDAQDVMLLSAVLHGLDDVDALRCLQCVAQGVGSTDARVLIMELVMPPRCDDPAMAAFDMQMLVGNRGKERTREQWCALFQEAGLELEEQVPLRSMGCILVLRHTA